uniref:Uncharacterized protein n=1 Tax=viral metagenome TaxID=1070528 RepID=A0A6M3IJ42_9ZZZZ
MSLSSSSTLDNAKDAYKDNLSYATTGGSAGVTKARLFVEACLWLLLEIPKAAGKGGASIQMNPELIRMELERAQAWIAANDISDNANAGVTHFSLEGFRT